MGTDRAMSSQPETAAGVPLARLKEHRVALVGIAVCLAVFVLLQSANNLPPKWTDIISHTIFALGVVLIVHVLDHMYLTRGSIRMMREQFEPVGREARESLGHLAAALASFAAMRDTGISRIYSNRAQASSDIARDLKADGLRKIRFIGVSLNDAILDNNKPLNDAYREIERKLKSQLESKWPSAARLDVKILILDPYTYGAQQRHLAETQDAHSPPGRLLHDVTVVAKRLWQIKKELTEVAERVANAGGPMPDIHFDCHLYRLAPEVFLVWTDRCCYTEQYCFWSSRAAQGAIPILQFEPLDSEAAARSISATVDPTDVHAEMEKHFDWIWNHASIPIEDFVNGGVIGWDMGLCQAGAVNVYMDQQRSAERIIKLLETAPDGAEVDLMGISLRSFFEPRQPIARVFQERVLNRPGVTTRILCIDPDSEQARFRSYCETLLGDEELDYAKYVSDAQRHKESSLCRDTEATLKRLKKLNLAADIPQPHCKLTAWMYCCAPSCFMLRIGDVVLFEPYSYGKLDRSVSTRTLGGDMPTFEFHRSTPDQELFDNVPNRNPWGLLKDHFEFVQGLSKPMPPVAEGSLPPAAPVTGMNHTVGHDQAYPGNQSRPARGDDKAAAEPMDLKAARLDV